VLGDAAEQLLRGLDDRAALADQVACAEHGEGVVGQRRRHVGTVRSAARARNRPRPGLALVLWLIALVLLAVTARIAAAAPSPAPPRDADADADADAFDDDSAFDDDDDEREIFVDERRMDDESVLDGDDDPITAGHRDALRRRRGDRPRQVDVTLGWRRRATVRDAIDGAARDELWLTATWRL
jgi:hypothetical protein